MKIEMRVDTPSGVKVETIFNVHECKGIGDDCYPAICEGCGWEADPEKPVYLWTVADGTSYFGCKDCLGAVHATLITE